MSTTVDQRVVEMRFDNRDFERNVATSMSTLEKLKQRLNLKGASKGLEDINSAAKKVDMNGLGRSVETVSAKFSAMQVVGVTALANITNSAVNAGKKMISALTIDPIKTGFQEYETQMNAVQTILANTQSKGSTLDDVNKALDTLNTYADKTIYNFTEMTRNIGTFTAAGVDLQTSVDSIQGIANLAAVSGSSSQQASTAMYQLSQALAAGRVSLMDWNSVVNAGMGGELFQNALIRTSELLKTGAKDAIATHGSFRESLTKGQWLTTEVLTETLKQISGAYSEADLIAQGFTKEQAKEIASLAETATNAATKVKTFSQLWDVMKESAQSGWSQTWKLIVGDFEQAKALLTPLADFFTGVIGKMSDARNNLLKGALGKGFGDLAKKIKGAIEPINSSVKTVKGAIDAVKDYSEVVNQIIAGDWGNGQTRWDALTKAGYDWAHAQNLVNEKLGNSYRRTTDYKEAQQGLTEAQKEGTATQTTLTEAEAKRLEQLVALSDAELKSLGYTDEQIKAFRELEKTADKLGMSISDLVLNIDEIDGRWLIWDSFKNVGQGIVAIFKAMGDAWREIFPPMTSDQLFNIIAGFHKLTSYLTVNEEAAEKFKRTFKGVFAALDIVLTIIGGPIKIAFKALTQLLGMFDLDILDVTASIGDAIVGFRDWIDSVLDFTKIFEKIIPIVKAAATAIRDWVVGIKNSEVAQNIIQGLTNGLKAGVSAVVSAVTNLGKTVLETIKNILGIHSPSREMFEIGSNIIQGLVNGIKNGLSAVWSTIKGLASKCVELLSNIDWGKIFAVGMSVGVVLFAKKMLDIFEMFGKGVEGFGKMCEGAGDLMTAFAERINPKKNKFKEAARAILEIAIAMGILAAAVYVLAQCDWKQLLIAVGALAALAAIMFVFAKASEKINVGEGENGFGKLALSLVGIAAALYIMASAIKKISFLNEENVGPILAAVIAMIGGLAGILFIFGTFVKGKAAQNIDKAGITILKISSAMLLLTFVIKRVSKLDAGEVISGSLAIAAFAGLVTGLLAATRLAGKKIDSVGPTLIKISIAMLLLVGVIKAVSKLDPARVIGGVVCIGLFELLIAGLLAITKLAGPGVDKFASTILSVSAAILMLGITARLLSGVDAAGLVKGIIAVAALGGIVAGLIAITKLAGKDIKGVSVTILAASFAIGVLAAVAVMLSLIDVAGLTKGIIAVSMLGGIMALLIHATKGATDVKGSITAMAIAIGVMAASVAALSFIDPSRLASATIALSIVMGMFALIAKCAGTMGKVVAPLIIMTVAVGLMAGMLAMLANIPNSENVLPVAAGLSAVMIALSAALKVVGTVGGSITNALKGILGLTAMVLPLAVFAAAIYFLPDLTGKEASIVTLVAVMAAMTVLLLALSGIGMLIGASGGTALLGIVGLTAMVVPLVAFGAALALLGVMSAQISAAIGFITPLTMLMTVMTVLLLALSGIGVLIGATGGMALLGIVGLTAMVVPLIAFGASLALIGLMSAQISKARPIFDMLTELIVTMTAVLVAVSLVGSLAAPGIAGIVALTGVIVALGALAASVGALITKFPQLEEFINVGLPILEKLAQGLGAIIGNFVSGLLVGAMSGLPEIGSLLTQFMNNASGFVTGIKMVDESVMTGVKTLGAALAVLLVADFVNQIATFDGTSFAQLGTELSMFMTNAMPFVTGAKMLDASMMEGVKALSSAILTLTTADLLDSITSWLTGGSSLADFGTQLIPFGTAMSKFSEQVKGIDEEAVIAAANAGKIMAEMQSNLVGSGGVVQWFTGDKDLATFGVQLMAFGSAMVSFSNKVKGNIDEDAIKAASNAGEIMAKLQEKIEPTGGVIDLFTGSNSLDTFGAQIVKFGSAIVGFSEEVKGIDEDAVNTAANVGKVMSKLAKNLPESGGFTSIFTADDDLSTFGSELKKFGGHIAGYAEKVSGLDTEAVNDSLDSVKNIVSTVNGLEKINSSGVESLQKAIDNLAKVNVDGLVNAFKGASSKLSTVGGDLTNSIAKGLKSKQSGVTNVARDIVTKAVNAVKSKTNEFNKIGSKLIQALTKGITSQNGKVKSAVGKVASAGVTKAREYYDNFQSAGKYVVSGFADGIDENTFKAEAQAAAMAKAALEAAEEALGVESPSKEFRRVGMFTVLGLVRGLQQYTHNATSASRDLANSVNDSFREELGIHSPSLVMNENGQYIVEGLAEGIDKDTTAEEAMKKKADNVASAFKTEIDKHDLDVNTAKLEYDLWSSENTDASELEKLTREAEYLNVAIAEQESVVALANREQEYMNELLAQGAVNAEQAQEAYNKWITESKDLVDLRNTLDGVNDSMSKIGAFDPIEEMAKHADKIKTISLEHELWNESYGTNADEARLAAANIEELSRTFTEQTSNVAIAQKAWNDSVAEFGPTSEEAKTAYDTLMQAMIDYSKTSNELTQAQESEAERQKVAKEAFDKYMREHLFLVEQGISREQIEKTASEITGHSIVPITSTVTEDIAKLTAKVWGEEYPEALSDAADKVDVPDSIAPDEYDLEESRKAYLGLAETPVDEVRGVHDDYEEAGEYLVEGFVDGMSNGLPDVKKAGAKVGTVAITATQQSLDVHSPSREFYKIGAYAIQGFVNAFGNGVRRVYDAGTEIADTAKNGLRDAIGKITAVINSDLDMQPTIRPVLDLSDVSANAGRIGDMLAFAPSIGTMSNLRAINSMMTNYSQNGGNDDVVSEIKKLRKGLGEVGGNTTYNVNGVTYDDGSNIATTVKDLVRAAKIERRI